MRDVMRMMMKPTMSSTVLRIRSTCCASASDRRNQKMSCIQMQTVATDARILTLTMFTSIWIIQSTITLLQSDIRSIQLDDCLKCFDVKKANGDQLVAFFQYSLSFESSSKTCKTSMMIW